MKKIFSSLPLRVSVLYTLIAGTWIIVSDTLLEKLGAPDNLQTYKGWFFVIVTASLLYIILNKLFEEVINHNKKLTVTQVELNNNKTLLNYIIDNLPQSIFWKDVNSVYLGCNKVFAEAAGAETPQDIVGKTDFDLPWLKEESEKYIADDKDVITNNMMKKNMEEQLKTASGEQLFISTTKVPLMSPNNKVIGVLGVFEDITNRKAAEEELKESETRYRRLFENNPQPMWVFEIDTFKFLAVNDAAVSKYGYSKEEFLSMTIKDIRPQEEIKDLLNYVAVRDENRIDSGIWKHELKNGKIILVEIHSHKIHFEGKNARLVLASDVTERKRAEQEIINSEKRFRTAVINAPFPIIIFSEDGKVLTLSKAWTEITGYSLEEIPTIEKWTEKAYGENKEKILGIIKDLDSLEGSKTEGEFEILCKNGKKRVWDFSSSSLGEMADGKKGIISMASDVTERKQAEKALRESENRHRSTLENMREGYQIIGFDWRYIYVNNTVCQQGHRTREELLGYTMMEVYPGIEKTEMFAVLQKCMKERVSEIFENEFIYEDGSKSWFQLSLQPVPEGIFILSLDVSEKKQNELAIEENVNKFRSLFESMIEGVAIHEMIYDASKNAVNYVILDVNPAFEKQIGIKKEFIIGKLATDAYQTETPPYLAEYQTVTETGEPFLFETYFPPLNKYFNISVNTPKTGFFVTVFQDITANKIAEEEILKLNTELEQRVKKRTEQLEEANKELEAFTYSVSHDLRSPLRAIDGFSKIVLEDFSTSLDDEAKRLLRIVRDNTRRMDHLITDLLALSRVTRGKLKATKINMRQMAIDVYDEIVPEKFRENLSFEIKEIPGMCGDSTLIKQVWSNLISNAVKYSTPKTNPKIQIDCEINESENIYSIKDNGVGFNPKYTHKLFGVFQRLHKDAEFEGTGVGLAIVERIIHRHNGKVWGEGKINEGAVFYFSLPNKENCNE